MVRVSDLVGRVSFVLSLVGTVWIGVIGGLIVADVVGRTLFDFSLTGVVEIAKTSIVAITFLTLPYAMHRRSHVRSTVIVSRLPPQAQRVLTGVAYAIGVASFVLIAVASWESMIGAWVTGEFEGEGALRVPTAPTRTIIVFASAVMTLECLLALTELVRGSHHTLEEAAP